MRGTSGIAGRWRKLAIVAAVMLVLPASLAAAAMQQQAVSTSRDFSAPVYDDVQRTSIYIPSGDGTKLAIDIYRPTKGGVLHTEKLPVIFAQDRPRGGRGGGGGDQIKTFTSRGYVWVGQDRRGTGASFGVQKGFVTRDDANDAKAVIDWAGSQPWSNGKVSAYGCSNQGAHQYVAASTKPKHLTSIAPECASPLFFEAMISANGVSSFNAGDQPFYKGDCNGAVTVGAPVDADVGPDFPLAKQAAEQHRCNSVFLGQYIANMHRDTVQPFLDYKPGLVDSAVQHRDAIKASGVKILSVAGWFDVAPLGITQGWQMWGGHVALGPWGHGQARAVNAKFLNGDFDRVQLYGRWYDATLKGIDNGFKDEAPIRYYTMNSPAGLEWRYAAAWPLPNQQWTSFYFGQGKTGLVKSFNDGALATAKPAGAGVDAYTPDYSADLFEGRYQALSRYWDGDMRKSMDEKGLTYTGPALDADLQITGYPLVDMWVTSTSKDEDFFAFLEDIGPDGRSTYVTDGKIRGSRRKISPAPWGDADFPWHAQMTADDQPLSASTPARLKFDMVPTSYIFQKGHRVRVTITNAAGKGYQALPGQDRKQPPKISLLRDAAHPSALLLPVIPAGSSVFAGQVSIKAKGVSYSGPGYLYASPKGAYIRYGDKWASFAGTAPLGAASYPVSGALGTATVKVTRGKGAWSASLAGPGLSFTGQGRDGGGGAGLGLGKA